MSQVPRRTKQIQRYYLDKKQAEKHCKDIELYFEQELRSYMKYAVNVILQGSILTHRQRVDFVRGWIVKSGGTVLLILSKSKLNL